MCECVLESPPIFSPVISYGAKHSLCCWTCGRGCEWNFHIRLSACRWMKSTYYAARVPVSSVRVCMCAYVCVCISPHYTHCVDLSRRVTPEARSPALLKSDALNYTTLGPIAGAQEHIGRGRFSLRLLFYLKHSYVVWMWRIFSQAQICQCITQSPARGCPPLTTSVLCWEVLNSWI